MGTVGTVPSLAMRTDENGASHRSALSNMTAMGLFDFFKAKVANTGVDISKRYAFLREAVSGTMSKFYKAKDLRSGRIVGLKVLDRERRRPSRTASAD